MIFNPYIRGGMGMMKKIVVLLLFFMLLYCGSVGANPNTVAISTFSSASWLPAEANKNACEIVDNYLMNRYETIVFDGSKATDKIAMSKHIGKGQDYVISIQLSGFYDPPFTTTHLSSNIKAADTVAMVMLEYTVYQVASEKWISGRVDQRVVYPGTTVILDAAYSDALKQAMPKLINELDTIIK